MGGLGLATEMTDERIEQNAYYCGYDCDTMVNNILVFGPDGKVFFCVINYPGSWLDGTLTARCFSHIKERIGEYKICVDQCFPRSGDATGILVGPIPERSAHRLHPLVRDNLIHLSNVYTSLRQAIEWGMWGLQGTFPRCKKWLPSNKEKCRRVLECIILLYNFRTEIQNARAKRNPYPSLASGFKKKLRINNIHAWSKLSFGQRRIATRNLSIIFPGEIKTSCVSTDSHK